LTSVEWNEKFSGGLIHLACKHHCNSVACLQPSTPHWRTCASPANAFKP